jgi:hypothetical protein
MGPNAVRDVVVDRAGVRFLFGHAELHENPDDRGVWLLAFPRQLVNTDFAHTLL